MYTMRVYCRGLHAGRTQTSSSASIYNYIIIYEYKINDVNIYCV